MKEQKRSSKNHRYCVLCLRSECKWCHMCLSSISGHLTHFKVCKLAKLLTSMCPPKHVWLAIIWSCIKPWRHANCTFLCFRGYYWDPRRDVSGQSGGVGRDWVHGAGIHHGWGEWLSENWFCNFPITYGVVSLKAICQNFFQISFYYIKSCSKAILHCILWILKICFTLMFFKSVMSYTTILYH